MYVQQWMCKMHVSSALPPAGSVEGSNVPYVPLDGSIDLQLTLKVTMYKLLPEIPQYLEW